LKGRGAKRRGCCPIHDGSNASQFHVDLNTNLWHCFGDCNRGGAHLEFVAEMERIAIRDAASMIEGWYAIVELVADAGQL
jgi:DNA primase